MNLTDKRIVITGANGGLGKSVAEVSASLGASLVLLDIAFSDVDLENNSPGRQCIALDLCDLDACKQCFKKIGPFDALFNLAGGFAMGTPAHAEDDEDWDFLFKLNVKTLRNAVKAATPVMLSQGHGKIVNVGALGALQGGAMMSAYSASKSVVMRLTESLSGELREQGINVNAVLPSVIDTPQNRAGMPDVNPADWVAPSDLANVICFLGSDAANAVHGALVPVRGLS
ncbi:MAG: SDR family NAD(P)-dependent oxidoreductase [Pseudomonadales bacterium]